MGQARHALHKGPRQAIHLPLVLPVGPCAFQHQDACMCLSSGLHNSLGGASIERPPVHVGTYKIPTANDIPIDFRVTLLKDGCNQRLPQVYSSKAVGEPPFFLGASVFFALKEAAYAARAEAGECSTLCSTTLPASQGYGCVCRQLSLMQPNN